MQGQDKQRRRPNGVGSLLERPDRRGGHKWVGKFTVKGEGRSVMRTIGAVKSKVHPDGMTRAKAEAKLQAMIEEAKINPERTKASKTLKDAGDELLRLKRADNRKPKTLEAIDSAVRVHIVPFFGATAVSKITPERVQQFRDALVEDKGLAVKSVANTMGVLHGLFAYAIDQGWATTNPVKKVSKPRSNAPVDVSYLTPEEVDALLRAVPDTELGRVDRLMYLMAAKTGLRQGELIALRWRDVRWTEGRVHVVQNYVVAYDAFTRRQVGQFQTPKSGKGRSVPVTPQVLRELELLHQASRWRTDDDLVFAHPDTGGPLERSRLLKRFKAAVTTARVGRFRPVLDELGKPKLRENGSPMEQPLLRFHDLRHTFGTQLARQGTPMRSIQEFMGHADFQTTLIYSHFAPGHDDAERIAAAFGEAPLAEPEAAATAPSSDDPLDRIQKLADLHAAGALDEDEFRAAKAAVLAKLAV